MLPDRVSNTGPLTYESGTLPIALRGPAFSLKPYVVTPHLNRLDKTVLIVGHKICFYREVWLTIPKLSL